MPSTANLAGKLGWVLDIEAGLPVKYMQVMRLFSYICFDFNFIEN